MRKRKGLLQSILFVYIILIILPASAKSYLKVSSDTSGIAYLPMNTGNKYIYKYQASGNINSRKLVVTTKDSVFSNGHKYFKFLNHPVFNEYNNIYWVRVDSLTGSVYNYDSTSPCSYYVKESFIDSLKAITNDIIFNCGLQVPTYYNCESISDINLFNNIVLLKKFHYFLHESSGVDRHIITSYAKEFGLYYYQYYAIHNTTVYYATYTLLGCVLNGVVYGDTSFTTVGMTNINSTIPEKFSLAQNFPNPFNPLTNINFDIPKNSFVNLKIYDVSGKELTSLVNENLNAGSYNFQWDASSFTSGVYFYRLEASDFDETKRMVLVK